MQNSHLAFCFEILSKISWDTLIALMGVLIAVIALIFSVRLQIISFVEAQLVEVAKTCNSYLQYDYQIHDHGIIDRGRASGIVTALEDAEKVIKFYDKPARLIFAKDLKYLKRVFYHHLHSSIKVLLKSALILEEPGFAYPPTLDNSPEPYDPIRKEQLDYACKFFEKEIRETWEFEKKREKRLGIT